MESQLDTSWPHPPSQKRMTMEWTATKDQMPEEAKMVILCHYLEGYVTAGYFEISPSGVWHWVADGENYFLHDFTHWMPLPEPPKQ